MYKMTIQEIKQNLSLIELLNHYGLKANKNKMLNCPFHEDKTPSMQIYEETNTAYCFSSNCKLNGKSIDQIDFIIHKENITKQAAIQKASTIIANHQRNSKIRTRIPNNNFPELRKNLHKKPQSPKLPKRKKHKLYRRRNRL